MSRKLSFAIFLIILSMIFGCNMLSQDNTVAIAIHCMDENISFFQVTCFISDASGNRIETKTFKVEKDKNEFWTWYSFKVLKSRQLVVEAIGVNSRNKQYREVSKKISVAGNKQNIYLSLEEEKVLMEEYGGATVKISGEVSFPTYKGSVEIGVGTEEDQKKLKYDEDIVPPTAKKIVEYTGGVIGYDLDVPVNLGRSIICVFQSEKAEPPSCQYLDIGDSDIPDINFGL